MPIIVPLWFYEFGSVMYFIAAFTGMLLTYFSFKLYNYTRKKSHLFLTLSFIFITIGFVILTASNTYSHEHFEQCNPDCTITNQQIFNTIVLGNYGYYVTSLIGYALFLFSYSMQDKKSRKKLFLQAAPPLVLSLFLRNQPLFVLYPFESIFFQPFQLISAILLLLIVIRTYGNYKKSNTKLAALVPAGFGAILVYHVLMFSLPFSPLFFAFAHVSLLIGFGALLVMLIKVERK